MREGCVLLLMITLLRFSMPHVFAATYTVNVPAQGVTLLNNATAPGGPHAGLTHQQVLQKYVNRDLRALNDQMNTSEKLELGDKWDSATPAARTNAEAALNAGITPPTLTPIADQTHPIGQTAAVPLQATDPDGAPISFQATGLPPGITVSSNPVTGEPQLRGIPTTAGVYTTVVRALKYGWTDIYAEDTFSWTIL